jgi:hypothetical protein
VLPQAGMTPREECAATLLRNDFVFAKEADMPELKEIDTASGTFSRVGKGHVK